MYFTFLKDEGGDEADLQSLVLLPPSVNTQMHKLEISIFKGDGLPKMDKWGKCDGYVAVKFGGNPEQETEAISNRRLSLI